jgi:hypothetical protein
MPENQNAEIKFTVDGAEFYSLVRRCELLTGKKIGGSHFQTTPIAFLRARSVYNLTQPKNPSR